MIEVERLSKRFGERTVLEHVSLTVEPGGFAVLLGPSGSGKSTLLRCLNGLVEPTFGVVRIGDALLSRRPETLRAVRRRVGMVFQSFNLIRTMSVLDNVLVGRLGRTPLVRALISTRTERLIALAALERVGLADRAVARAGALSGGEQQRVGIARALVQRPEVILADEPVSNLDPVTAAEVLALLARINREERVTVLCSLHQVELASRFGDRVYGLARGRVVFAGRGADLDAAALSRIYGRPETDGSRRV